MSNKIKQNNRMSLLDQYRKNGFVSLRNGVDFKKTEIESIRFSGSTDDLIRESKDHGAVKANGDFILNRYSDYADFLCSSGIIRRCESIVGQKVYPRKLAHLISDSETTKSHPWHRDSYIHRGKQIGPLPPPLKLAVFLTPVNKLTGVTGFLPGSYHVKINNRYVDYAYAVLNSFRAVYYEGSVGDAILWDGSVMHHRPKTRGQTREVVIFNLSLEMPKIKPRSLIYEYERKSAKHRDSFDG